MAKKRARPAESPAPAVRKTAWSAAAIRFVLAAWAVLLILVLCPYTSDPAGPIKDLISSVAVLLMACIGLLGVVFERRPLRFRRVTIGLLTIFLFVNVLAALFSGYRAHSLDSLRPWVSLSLLTLLAAQAYRRPDQVWRLIGVVVGAVALSSVYGLSQRFGFDPFPWSQTEIEEYHGLPSTYANPNFAGHALVIAFLMACGLAWKGSRRRPLALRTFAVFCATLIGTHLYLTHMRGGRVALIGTAVALGVFVLLRRRTRSALRAALLSGLVLVVLGVAAGAAMFTVARHPRDDAPLSIDGSLVLRLNGYYGASRMALEHPVLGIGPGNYTLENIPYWTPYEKQWFSTAGKKNVHVHSDPLEAAVDAGFPGAAAYLALLIWAVLAGLTRASSGTDAERGQVGLVLAACFIAFSIDGLFGFNLRVPVSAGLFFLLLGILDAPVCAGPAGPARDRKRRCGALPAALLVVAVAALCAYFSARGFLGERAYQRALGARHWAGEFRRQEKPGAEARALTDAYAALERGRAYLPWDPRFPENQGQIDLKLRRLDAAVARFSEALSLCPQHPGLMIHLAQAHINRAVAFMGQLPENTSPGTAVADVFERNLDEAREYAERARGLCGVHPEPYEALGRTAFLRAVAREQAGAGAAPYWTDAIASFRQALRYGAPARAALQRMLGEACMHVNQMDAAEEALRRAAESDPADDETWALFHTLAKEQGRARAFIDALNTNLGRVKQLRPVPAAVVATLALHLADMYASEERDPDMARAVLRDALALDVQRLDLWGFLITLSPAEERLQTLQAEWKPLVEEAERTRQPLPPVFSRIVHMAPTDPDGILGAGRLLEKAAQERRKSGSAQQISRELSWMADVLQDQAAVTPMPPETQARLLARLGTVYIAAGRWRTADGVLARAIPVLPAKEQGSALMYRSEALDELGQKEDAVRLAREAARLAPNDASVRWNLARRLTAAGFYAEAKFEYVALIKQLGRRSPLLPDIEAEYRALERTMGQTQTQGGTS